MSYAIDMATVPEGMTVIEISKLIDSSSFETLDELGVDYKKLDDEGFTVGYRKLPHEGILNESNKGSVSYRMEYVDFSKPKEDE